MRFPFLDRKEESTRLRALFSRREGALAVRKADNLPLAEGREVLLALWVRSAPRRVGSPADCFTPREVLRALR
jgi:hypothetical protein